MRLLGGDATPHEEIAAPKAASTQAPVGERRLYVSVPAKFSLAMAFTVMWVWLSVWISGGWVRDLEPVAGAVLAWVMVILVAYLPGAIVALMIVSAWTLAVLPVTLLVYGGLRTFQVRHVFGPMGLQVRRNRLGYVAFLLGYQMLCSTAALAGYGQHLVRAHRRWK